ncbi:MAG TPA: CAP domain-containing protein [Steroidobacteraceae bacterium]|nr:CAP domain-containing protein [Steroidobacteraceae bacterium]
MHLRASPVAGCVIALLCFALSPVASAAIDKGVNGIRQRGCDGKSGLRAALRRTRGLDDVAREWSKGGRLTGAIAKTDYRVANSASMHIEGAKNEKALLQIVAGNYCEVVLNPEFTEIGVYERGDSAWIVVAVPEKLPTADEMPQVTARVLKLVNEARAQRRKCGSREFAPAPPLTLSPVLSRAALAHARDMSANKFFEHRGSDGSKPSERATRAGYDWAAIAENIAEGAVNADVVVQGWLDSPGHCVNIMGAQYREMGLAYFTDFAHKGDIYWAQTFGTQKKK